MYNPPPIPPGYGQQYPPYGMQGAHQASANTLPGAEPGAKSAMGIDGNVAGALAYIGPFNIVFAIIEKENRFVRFNAFQSLFLGLSLLVADFVCIGLGLILMLVLAMAQMVELAAIAWMVFVFLMLALSMLAIAGIVMAAVKAYQRKMFKLPLVGNWAERIVRKM